MSGFGTGAQTRPRHSALCHLIINCMPSMFASQVLRMFLGASSKDCGRDAPDVIRQTREKPF